MSQPDNRDVRGRVTAELHPTETPDAGSSALARATDPAAAAKQTPATATTRAGGVSWVPAADVLRGHGHRLADWHAATQERVVRAVRHSAGQAATAPVRAIQKTLANRTAALPPVTQFGQTTPATQHQAVGA